MRISVKAREANVVIIPESELVADGAVALNSSIEVRIPNSEQDVPRSVLWCCIYMSLTPHT